MYALPLSPLLYDCHTPLRMTHFIRPDAAGVKFRSCTDSPNAHAPPGSPADRSHTQTEPWPGPESLLVEMHPFPNQGKQRAKASLRPTYVTMALGDSSGSDVTHYYLGPARMKASLRESHSVTASLVPGRRACVHSVVAVSSAETRKLGSIKAVSLCQ
jgi:hypothetical protein